MTDLDGIEILLVEDNPRDAELTLRALKEHNLANGIVHLEDGAQALDFLLKRGEYAQLGRENASAPKVVFLDLKLPKVGGLEVLRVLKGDEATRQIPVVMITSSSEDPDIRAAYQLGANSYIVKPVEFGAFVDVMNAAGYYWLLINEASE